MSRVARLVGVLAVFAFVSSGVFVWPEGMLQVEEGDSGLLRQAAAFLVGLLYILIWFGVPLLLVIAILGNEATAGSVTALLTLAMWLVGLGLPVVIVGASVGSTNEQFVMSTLKALALFLLVIGGRELAGFFRNRQDRWAIRIAALAALLLVGFSGWSLTSAGAALVNAGEIAEDDAAYCIAYIRDVGAPYRLIESLFALHGVDLVVETSGVEARPGTTFIPSSTGPAETARPTGTGRPVAYASNPWTEERSQPPSCCQRYLA